MGGKERTVRWVKRKVGMKGIRDRMKGIDKLQK